MKKGAVIIISLLILLNCIILIKAQDLNPLVVWDDRLNTIAQYRIFNGTAWSDENNTQDLTGDVYYPILIEIAVSPSREEAVLATMSDLGGFNPTNIPNVFFQVWNGSEWGNNFTTNFSSLATHPGGSGETYRSLDVEYYTNTHALAVWWDFENAITADITIAAYAIWDGNNWKEMNNTPDWTGTKDPKQQELDCYVSNEECVLVQTVFDTNKVFAGVWNGTDWGYNTSILEGANLSFYTVKGIDVEYDHNGNAMVVVSSYIDNNPPDTDSVFYRIWNSTSKTWGPLKEVINSLDRPGFIELAVHPTENEMAMIVVDTDNIARVAVWNGTGWGNNQTVNTFTPYNYFTVDIAYDKDGNAMAVFSNYGGGGTIDIGYIIWNGTGWGSAGKAIDMSVGANWHTNIRLVSDPNSNEMILTDVSGADHHVNVQVWNGTAWGNNLTLDTAGHYWTRSSAIAYGEFGGAGDTPTNLNVYIVPGANLDCDDNIVVHGNYTAAGAHVDGASCNVTFAHAPMGPFAMNDATNDYNYSRTDRLIALTGITTYTIYCSKAGYQSLNTTGSINVTTCTAGEEDGVIPEFNIIGIFLILIIAITGYVIVSKRNLSK